MRLRLVLLGFMGGFAAVEVDVVGVSFLIVERVLLVLLNDDLLKLSLLFED